MNTNYNRWRSRRDPSNRAASRHVESLAENRQRESFPEYPMQTSRKAGRMGSTVYAPVRKMLDGETYVVKSTSKVGPLQRIDQLSHRERNKIEKLAQKRGRVYVLDIWNGNLAFVVLPGGEWIGADDWREREEQRELESIRTGSWLRDAMGEERWRELRSDDGDD